MLRPDELERLSRYAAGELPPDEKRAVDAELKSRPELAEGLRWLGIVDEGIDALPDDLDDARVEKILAGVDRPRIMRPRWPYAAGLAAAIAAAVAIAAWPRAEPEFMVVLSGEAQVNGSVHRQGRK